MRITPPPLPAPLPLQNDGKSSVTSSCSMARRLATIFTTVKNTILCQKRHRERRSFILLAETDRVVAQGAETLPTFLHYNER